MKKALRSLLSMVLVASMTLSMALVSGLSVGALTKAAQPNAKAQFITADQVLCGDAYADRQVNSTVSGNGNSWKLTVTEDCNAQEGSIAALINLKDAAALQDLPFLVLKVAADNTADFCWLGWVNPDELIWLFGSWSDKGSVTLVYDLREVVADGDTFALQLWCKSSAATVFSVDAMYLTDRLTDEAVPTHIKDMSTVLSNNVTAQADGENGVAFTVIGAGAYAYYNLPQSSARYLVYKLKEDSAAGAAMYLCETLGWDNFAPLPAPTATRTVVDLTQLSSYNKNSAMTLQIEFTATTAFEYFFFADDPNLLAQSESTHVKDMSTVLSNNVTAQADGENGVAFTVIGAGAYAYYNLPQSSARYLVYKLKEDSAAGAAMYLCETLGWANFAPLPAPAATRTVVDLTQLSSYNKNSAMTLQIEFTATTAFEYFFFADDSDLLAQSESTHVKDLSTVLGNNVTAQADGENGVAFTVIDSGAYAYYNLPQSSARYLVYKLKEDSAAGAAMYLCETLGWDNFAPLPAPTTTRTVVDLTQLSSYNKNSAMTLQIEFTATTAFEEFFFTDDPDLSAEPPEAAPDIIKHAVSFVTNGGSKEYAQLVADGGLIDAVSVTKNGYLLQGWYTDADMTQAFDFATPVTAPMTLYAKWGLSGTLSPVFAQLRMGTATSPNASIRFVAAIDSLQFREVGFVLSLSNANPTIGGERCHQIGTKTVYSSILANGKRVSAASLHGKYLYAVSLNNIPPANFDLSTIYVRAYTLDKETGAPAYSDVKQYNVTEMMMVDVADPSTDPSVITKGENGGIETVGLYVWDPNPDQYDFWKACGYNLLQFCDRSWFWNANTETWQNYMLTMQSGIRQAQQAGFKVEIVFFSNILQYYGPDAVEPTGVGVKFHPDNAQQLQQRLDQLRTSLSYMSQADSFSIVAGDPGGIADNMGDGDVYDFIKLAVAMGETINDVRPDVTVNINTWAVSNYQTPNAAYDNATFWERESELTKILFEQVGDRFGWELACHDYYRPLTLQSYVNQNRIPSEAFPTVADLEMLKQQGVEHLWAWPYFLLDEADDGHTGDNMTQLPQLESRYICDYLSKIRQAGFNGAIGSWSYAGYQTRMFNIYAFGRACHDASLTPEQLICEFACIIATPETRATLVKVLKYIENDSNFSHKTPEQFRQEDFGTAISSNEQALVLLQTVQPNTENTFPLPYSPAEYLADLAARLQ